MARTCAGAPAAWFPPGDPRRWGQASTSEQSPPPARLPHGSKGGTKPDRDRALAERAWEAEQTRLLEQLARQARRDGIRAGPPRRLPPPLVVPAPP